MNQEETAKFITLYSKYHSAGFPIRYLKLGWYKKPFCLFWEWGNGGYVIRKPFLLF